MKPPVPPSHLACVGWGSCASELPADLQLLRDIEAVHQRCLERYNSSKHLHQVCFPSILSPLLLKLRRTLPVVQESSYLLAPVTSFSGVNLWCCLVLRRGKGKSAPWLNSAWERAEGGSHWRSSRCLLGGTVVLGSEPSASPGSRLLHARR